MYFTTGRETSLNQLANDIIELFQSRSRLVHQTPRDFDVSRFSGNPALAEAQLGWRHDPASLQYFLSQYVDRLGYNRHPIIENTLLCSNKPSKHR